MQDHFRQFTAGPDPFGRTWNIQFRWLQTGISIRHADTVDVKFLLMCEGEPDEEKVIALPHPLLLEVAKQKGRMLTDAWCLKLGALHIRHMVESAEDIEKTIVTMNAEEIARYDSQLQSSAVGAR